jgi:hypothetical protein
MITLQTPENPRRAGRVAQIIEYLPSKQEALIQTQCHKKTKKTKKTRTKQNTGETAHAMKGRYIGKAIKYLKDITLKK